ncbi:MAG: lipoate--protein ligase [Acidobacteriota bacterium]|nr:lipoate--protein ligase [Acidobacteriota bacterium]
MVEDRCAFVDYDWGDPWRNLAWETCLFERVAAEARAGVRLFVAAVWQNDDTIVIGRNQDPRAECDMSVVKARGVKVARRFTGGGAVYHDMGNLNFTFCLPRADYDVSWTSGVVLGAVRALGVRAELSGRNDILADGRKFSGNAFRTEKYAGLHHGTILIRSDARNIRDCLTPDKLKFKRAETASVESRVVTLSELVPELTVARVKRAVKERFLQEVGALAPGVAVLECGRGDGASLVDAARFEEVSRLYASEEWIWGAAPAASELVGYFPWGKLALSFFPRDGKVYDCGIATDSLHVDVWRRLKGAWIGKDYAKGALLEGVDKELAAAAGDLAGVLRDVRRFVQGATLP